MDGTKGQKSIKIQHMLIIATIGLAPLLGNLDGSIVMIASPVLATVFHTDSTGISIIIIAYLLATASLSLIFGRLGDIIGPAKVFFAGFAVITVGSLLCGMAPGLNSLVAFRVVQAIGSTMLCSTYCAIVVTGLPRAIRGRAFGFTGVLGSIGFAIGAPVGGFMLDFLSWHWLFLFNIPFSITGLVLSFKLMRQEQSSTLMRTPFDVWGALLSVICLLTFVYALNERHGWGNPSSLALFGISFVSFFLFFIREKTFSAPLVDITIFKNLFLILAVMAAFLIIILLDGVLFLFPYFLELVKKLSSEKAGLVMMVMPASVLVFSPLAGYLSDKKSPRLIASLAVVFILASTILFSFLGAHTHMSYVLFSFLLFGISIAFFMVSNVTIVMSHAVEGKEGVLSGIIAVINNVGALMGVSFFQIVFSMRLSGNVKEFHLIPPGELMAGFQRAMIFAVIVCLPALIASILAGERGGKE